MEKNPVDYDDLLKENKHLQYLCDLHEAEQDKMLVIASAAEFARNRLLLYLNKTGHQDSGLQNAFDKLEKALKANS